VEAAAAGTTRRVPTPPLAAQALRPGADGGPLLLGIGDSERFSCKVPDDVESLRRNRPEVAHAWRVALRELMGALGSGGRVLGLDDDGDYVVERSPYDIAQSADDSSVDDRGLDAVESNDGRP
jgi:predicted GNAT superfamily acetyltransferase